MLTLLFHRPSNSLLETSFQRSATYEHELKDLEVQSSSYHISRASSVVTDQQHRKDSSKVSVTVGHWRVSFLILLPPSRCAAPTPLSEAQTLADHIFARQLFFLQWKYRRAGHDTLRKSVPQIDEELAESLRVLAELEARLPVIRTQATQVQRLYDSGRHKVRDRLSTNSHSLLHWLTSSYSFNRRHLSGGIFDG